MTDEQKLQCETDAAFLAGLGLFNIPSFRKLWLKQRSTSQKDLVIRSWAAMGDTRIRNEDELNLTLDFLDSILKERDAV